MNTNITKTWTIEIREDEVFARCTNESLYQAYVRTADNQKGDAVVMQDDDREQFRRYFDAAIAYLHMMLARYMEEPMYECRCNDSNGRTITFLLQMHDNHDNVVLPLLINHCYEYIIKKVLEQWYLVDFGSKLEELEVKHCLHYRKHPVRRRVRPLF